MIRTRRSNAPILPYAAAALALSLAIAAIRGCALCRAEPDIRAEPTISVYDHEAGRAMDMELNRYLICVVGAEMPASFPLEALKAQAVAARTYALRRMSAYGGEGCGRGGCDICTDSACCQAFSHREELEEGYGEEAALYMDKLEQAVYGTEGIIAAYEGRPIEALYHSCAGGRTEDAQNVFSAALPYLVGVSSPGEEEAGRYTARYDYTPREFEKLINRSWPGARLDRDKLHKQVEVLSRYESGQVEELRLGSVTVSGKEMRKLLGLNSANFTIDCKDGVCIRTTGYGHGVGMSQYGARAMALSGADYREILLHYYTGVEVEKFG